MPGCGPGETEGQTMARRLNPWAPPNIRFWIWWNRWPGEDHGQTWPDCPGLSLVLDVPSRHAHCSPRGLGGVRQLKRSRPLAASTPSALPKETSSGRSQNSCFLMRLSLWPWRGLGCFEVVSHRQSDPALVVHIKSARDRDVGVAQGRHRSEKSVFFVDETTKFFPQRV